MKPEFKEALKIINLVRAQPKKFILGVDHAVDKLVLALFSLVAYEGEGEKKLGQAHVLLWDVPGVGKSGLIRCLAASIDAKLSIILGEPTMTTRDIIGGEIYNPKLGKFFQIEGPIFANIFFFDELNRAHPKASSVLLPAMEERIVILTRTDIERGVSKKEVYRLYPISEKEKDRLFFWLLATSNPIEQEGTYSIPEAVRDRFTFAFKIGYPDYDSETKIRFNNLRHQRIEKVTNLAEVLDIANLIVDSVGISPSANEYITRLIRNSRPHTYRDAPAELIKFVDSYVAEGVASRANFHFEAGVRTFAFMRGKDLASVDDVKVIAPLVMGHRLILSSEARGEGIKSNQVVQKILEETEVPS